MTKTESSKFNDTGFLSKPQTTTDQRPICLPRETQKLTIFTFPSRNPGENTPEIRIGTSEV